MSRSLNREIRTSIKDKVFAETKPLLQILQEQEARDISDDQIRQYLRAYRAKSLTSEEVFLKAPYLTSKDLFDQYDNKNGWQDQSDGTLIFAVLMMMEEWERNLMTQGYESQLIEYWRLMYDEGDISSTQYVRENTANLPGNFFIDPLDLRMMQMLEPEKFRKIFYSRLFPTFSQHEIDELNKATVIILGASSASWVAALAVKNGIEHVILSDFDRWGVSNNTRAYGGGIKRLEMPKAYTTGRFLAEDNPYADIEMYMKSLNIDELEAVIRKAAEQNKEGKIILVEAIDGGEKMVIRELCDKISKELGREIVVTSGNNFGSSPSVSEHRLSHSDFFAQLNAEDRAIWSTAKLKDRIHIAIKIVKEKNLDPRAMINLVLFSAGKQMYITQTGVNAALTGSLVTYDLYANILDYSHSPGVGVSLPKIYKIPAKVQEAADMQLLTELQEMYPSIFTEKYSSLIDAINRVGGLNYHWSYEEREEKKRPKRYPLGPKRSK